MNNSATMSKKRKRYGKWSYYNYTCSHIHLHIKQAWNIDPEESRIGITLNPLDVVDERTSNFADFKGDLNKELSTNISAMMISKIPHYYKFFAYIARTKERRKRQERGEGGRWLGGRGRLGMIEDGMFAAKRELEEGRERGNGRGCFETNRGMGGNDEGWQMGWGREGKWGWGS